VSWKPLVKSNASAVTTTTTSRADVSTTTRLAAVVGHGNDTPVEFSHCSPDPDEPGRTPAPVHLPFTFAHIPAPAPPDVGAPAP